MTEIVNLKTEEYDIYIGRPSIWGNPFQIWKCESREKAIEHYRSWLLGKTHTNFKQTQREQILKRIEQLRGKRLGCYCKPLSCHGDVLLEVLGE